MVEKSDKVLDFINKINEAYKSNPQKFRSIFLLILFGIFIIGFIAFHLKKKEQDAYKSFIEASYIYSQEMNTDTPAYDRIIASYNKVININPKSKFALESFFTIADCYYYKKEYNKAIEHYDKFLKNVNQNNPLKYQALLSKGLAFQDNKMKDKAIGIFNDLYNNDNVPEYVSAQAGIYFAILNEQDKNYQNARKIYNEIMKKFNDTFWADEALLNIQRLSMIPEKKQSTGVLIK